MENEQPHFKVKFTFFGSDGVQDGEPYVRTWRHSVDAWSDYIETEEVYKNQYKRFPKFIDGYTMKLVEDGGAYTIVEIIGLPESGR